MFNNQDKTIGVILSSDMCTISFDDSIVAGKATTQYARTVGTNTGKKYFEVKINSNNGTGLSVGVTFKKPKIEVLCSYSYYYQGGVRPSSKQNVKPFATNDIIGVAIDLDSKPRTISFYNNNNLQSIETVLEAEVADFYPFVSQYYYAPSGSATINLGSKPFVYSIPSGFEAFSPNKSYLIKKDDNKIYGFRKENYNSTTKMYNVISDDVNYVPTSTDYETLGNSLDELIKEIIVDGETFKPIDKFKKFKIVSNTKKILNIEGMKTSKELIVSMDHVSRKVANNIDYFDLETSLVGNAKTRIAVSNDKGQSWYSYKDNTWISIDTIIPHKSYEELTEDEKVQWNDSLEKIRNNGIDASALKTVNFNTLSGDFITFAYVIESPSYSELASFNKLKWQFDSIGTFRLMKDTEVDIDTSIESVTITPKINNDIIKVNILLNEAGSLENVHTHENKELLDKFTTDTKGDLNFEGKPICTSTSNISIDDNIASISSVYSSKKTEDLLLKTKNELVDLISKLETVSIEIVDSLDKMIDDNVIYLLLIDAENRIYSQYIVTTIEGNRIPSLISSTKIDLSNYYTKIESDNKFQQKGQYLLSSNVKAGENIAIEIQDNDILIRSTSGGSKWSEIVDKPEKLVVNVEKTITEVIITYDDATTSTIDINSGSNGGCILESNQW